MKEKWVHQCWAARNREVVYKATDEEFVSSCKSKPFEGCILSFLGFSGNFFSFILHHVFIIYDWIEPFLHEDIVSDVLVSCKVAHTAYSRGSGCNLSSSNTRVLLLWINSIAFFSSLNFTLNMTLL